jgi:gamma-glutamylcyclotransferase (GGCT)/AIG2-like uncharacterized protein YtfP
MNDTTDRLPLFVYGTLRTGQGNWRHLLRGTTVSETPAVAPDHALYADGIAFAHQRAGAQVQGDLMVLPADRYDAVLARLDRLEGYDAASDSGLYLRRTCTVQTAAGATCQAFIYLGSPRVLADFTDRDLVPDGDWVTWARQRGGRAVCH